MKKNSSFVQKNKKLLLSVFLGVIVVIGVSYAWLQITLTGTKKVVIRSGNLSLNLDEDASEGISLTNAYPMTDQEGLKTTSYDFTLKNDGTIPNSYTIYLEDTTGEAEVKAFPVLKYDIKKTEYNADDSIKTAEVDTMQLLSAIKTTDGIVLDSGTLEVGEYSKYSFKLWMDYDANDDYQNSHFKGNLKIVGDQIKK